MRLAPGYNHASISRFCVLSAINAFAERITLQRRYAPVSGLFLVPSTPGTESSQ